MAEDQAFPDQGQAYPEVSHYEVYDRHAPAPQPALSTHKSLRNALRAVDRRDNAYGAYRYGRRTIYKDQT